mmetsp:Transcript_14456/g.28156  ORF Transcript_14456/g.28156 Transcript_14456/m.28156 type:complete len:247 (-) Transcript_14456:157-897(-)
MVPRLRSFPNEFRNDGLLSLHDKTRPVQNRRTVLPSPRLIRHGPPQRRIKRSKIQNRHRRHRKQQHRIPPHVHIQRAHLPKKLVILIQSPLRHRHHERRYQIPPHLLDALHRRLIARIRDVHRQFGIDGLYRSARNSQPQQRQYQQYRFVPEHVIRQTEGNDEEHGGEETGQGDGFVTFRFVDVSSDENSSEEDGEFESGPGEVDAELIGDSASFHDFVDEGPDDVGDGDAADEGGEGDGESFGLE